jgi:transcriptional regulator with XRE-family HTH domain
MKQEDIGAFIANLRKEKGWTQKEMASHLGVSDKAISKWETGKSLPDMGMLIPVSELLGITVDELLSGKKRNNDFFEGNSYEPNKVIIDYANRTIKRIKKHYRLIPTALLGILILSGIILSGLGYSFGLNTKPESPLKGIIERNPIDTIAMADMTDEEQALSNFANGIGLKTNYLSYRLSEDKKLVALGLYIFDGTKWTSDPIISNGESRSGLISVNVKNGVALIGYYEADGYASYSTERPLIGYQESWAWGSGISSEPIEVTDKGTIILTFWVAAENNVSISTDSFSISEVEWLAERGSLEGNACVVALYMVVE